MIDLDALIDRLDRLDRENQVLRDHLERTEVATRRRSRRGQLALFGGCVLLIAGAAWQDRVIEAERIVIRDVEGHRRIELGTNDKGVGYQLFYDRDGTQRIDIGHWNGGGAYLFMNDPDGDRRVDLGEKEAQSWLILHDKDGERRVDLGVDRQGGSYLFRNHVRPALER